MSPAWLVIGISGVTCGGKTILANRLYNHLTTLINTTFGANICINCVHLMAQDKYFLPIEHNHHKWIKELNHINWELLSAIDMDRMCKDLHTILGPNTKFYVHDPNRICNEPILLNILIIEGFLIFNHPTTRELCHLKFHLHVPFEKCFARRKLRTYDPPDVLGYFEMCVWPMYEKHFREYQDDETIVLLNGDSTTEKIFEYVLACITNSI